MLASGLLDVEAFPDLAAQWLANGMDSENLRMLAGANHEDPYDIRDLWAATLKDLELQPVPLENRWQLIWAYELATWKVGERTKGQVLRDAVSTFKKSNMKTGTPRKPGTFGICGTSSAAPTTRLGPTLRFEPMWTATSKASIDLLLNRRDSKP